MLASAGYNIQVVPYVCIQLIHFNFLLSRYDLAELTDGIPGSKWAKGVILWQTTDFFYTHLSDVLRFVLLYRYAFFVVICY